MKVFIKLALALCFLQIKGFAFAQTSSGKTVDSYIISFNPVFASGLMEIDQVGEQYLIVTDIPLKIDSVMAALSKKSYSQLSDILDTLKQTFKVYSLKENDLGTKKGNKINQRLNEYCRYGKRFLFPLNDTVKQHSSLVGFVISRYFFLESGIKYKVLNDNCVDFPNECKAMITDLQ